MQEGLFIGIMTGTSLDAVDAALVEIRNNSIAMLDAINAPISDALTQAIQDVSTGAQDGLAKVARLDIELAKLYSETVNTLLEKTSKTLDEITAIGCHGQTVRHSPQSSPAFTVQLGNGAYISQETGITTINNFRQMDMALGGQGAPLAPLFHHHLFADSGKTVIGLNLGGIANISILHADGKITGFDTGPANTLMNQWIQSKRNTDFDKNGDWARSGTLIDGLLEKLLSEPWLALSPPKSTGPELFNLDWLKKYFNGTKHQEMDVQNTLCEFSALTITNSVKQYSPDCTKIIACGGGAYNTYLMERIQHHAGTIIVENSSVVGIPPEWIEATMFAWLAWRTLNRLPGNVPEVTGASKAATLGCLYYPAN